MFSNIDIEQMSSGSVNVVDVEILLYNNKEEDSPVFILKIKMMKKGRF